MLPGYDPFEDTEIAGVGDCYFDEEAAVRVLRFFHEHLTHIEGTMARQPFILQRWQQSQLANLFGWKRPDGHRRYRTCFDYEARKNGKTPKAAGVALYLNYYDNEWGAEIQCAASSGDQASKLYRHAKGMALKHKHMGSKQVTKFHDSVAERKIVYGERGNFIKVLNAEAHTQHGGNPHGIICDELHAWPNWDLFNVLRTSMASANRSQSLMLIITTADYDRPSPCNDMLDYARAVIDGTVSDPTFLPVLYENSPEADYEDPETWRRANPNIGVSVSEEFLSQESKRARRNASYRDEFKRLHCNIVTSTSTSWIDLAEWDTNQGLVSDGAELAGHPAIMGVDLSATRDMTAIVTVIDVDGVYLWIPRFFIPEGFLPNAGRFKSVYEQFVSDGLLTVTEGESVDYMRVEESILADVALYGVSEVHFDRALGGSIMSRCQNEHGLTVVEVNQGIASMSPMLKTVDGLVGARKIDHRGHGILRWNVAGAMKKIDENENIKLLKNKSTSRIDGLIAGTMATHRLVSMSESRVTEGITFL